MPNIKSAYKSIRQDKKRHAKNIAAISEIRTLTKKARALVTSSKRDEADAALRELESKLDKAAKTNKIKKNNAARKISRLRSQWAKIGKAGKA